MSEGAAVPGRAVQISSPSNPRVRWLRSLRKRSTRDAERLTVVEGHDELVLALESGVRPQLLVVCPDLVGATSTDLVDDVRTFGSQVVTMSRAAFAKASYRESPDGWMAVVSDPASRLDVLDGVLERREARTRGAALLLVCEAVEKPGNLGAILRTAEAAGVDAVVSASPVADWGNPNVVRASKGTVFAVPVAAAPAVDVISWLRARSVHIVVMTPETDVLVTDIDLTGPSAIVVGAEHDGVSSVWFDATRVGADATSAKLPMVGRINSLNVATSAALAVYEAVRQRAL